MNIKYTSGWPANTGNTGIYWNVLEWKIYWKMYWKTALLCTGKILYWKIKEAVLEYTGKPNIVYWKVLEKTKM